MKKLFRGQSKKGQAVVEYILLLAIVVSMSSVIIIGFRRSIFAFWTFMVQKVAAACPSCQPPPNIRSR